MVRIWYINRFGQGQRETVNEYTSRKDAALDAINYHISDPSARYWVSSRPCKNWSES
jgi:hypothetical protein